MLIISGLTILLFAVTALSRDSALGKALRSGLVEAPARALNRLRPGRVVFFVLVAVAGLAMTLLFETEGLRLFGAMLPDLMIWFAVFDVGVFIEALLIAGAILGANGLATARAKVAALPRTVAGLIARGVARARRPRLARPRPTGSADENDGPRWAPHLGYRPFSIA